MSLPAKAMSMRMAAAPTTSPARLLIADDDVAVRSVLEEYLCLEHECESVGSAEEALAALDLALFNFGQSEDARATMGSRAEPDAALRGRVERALGL